MANWLKTIAQELKAAIAGGIAGAAVDKALSSKPCTRIVFEPPSCTQCGACEVDVDAATSITIETSDAVVRLENAAASCPTQALRVEPC
ncbi:hypothetical protein [Pseudomonas citronellolis]|uniref:hypothetical protein n=1 Tax=Pseudomonas citronellolis TaxID=53408 RepID=UPI0023E3A040|nr:hypothetical protein [Pseudomonas citronellolis]MDF3932298.1 hypothetical protein [Pseudomonas citronellolis]